MVEFQVKEPSSASIANAVSPLSASKPKQAATRPSGKLTAAVPYFPFSELQMVLKIKLPEPVSLQS